MQDVTAGLLIPPLLGITRLAKQTNSKWGCFHISYFPECDEASQRLRDRCTLGAVVFLGGVFLFYLCRPCC